MSIWKTLSAIDCSEHIEQKGRFSYLSWTWAWAMVKENYPRAHYTLRDDIVYPDGTMEVRVNVTIPDGGPDDGVLCHTMWLPVLDYNNKAISNPNAFDINTARMRCLVKCLAMFGLGHYIYAGESTPGPSPELTDKYEEMLGMVAQNQYWQLRKFVDDNQPHMDNLFNMAPHGNKTKFKDDVRKVYGLSNEELKKNLGILEDAVGNPDTPWSVTETMTEMDELERIFVYKAMNEVLRKQVDEKLDAGE
jgi:hypothetical protein